MTFEDTLAQWLPAQRWFAGRHEPARGLTVIADTALATGDPELRHLIVSVPSPGGEARYQVLVGLRARVPPSLSHAIIGPAGTRTAYDALHDPELSAVLVESIAAGRTAGPLRFAREPDAPSGSWPGSRVLTAEQSNTSVVFGEAAILKVLRRLFPGENPDLEVASALARLGSKRIATPYGRIQTQWSGEPVLLGVLSQYLAHASDGWSLAAASLRRLYARHGAYEQEYLTVPVSADAALPGAGALAAGGLGPGSVEAGGLGAGAGAPGTERPAGQGGGSGRQEQEQQFDGEAYLLGRATAEMHADLATAFGTRQMEPAELDHLARAMIRKLELAAAEVPELGAHAAKVHAAYENIAKITEPVPLQRIHGDYHLGQVLRTQDGWVALDFEGEPAVPLAERRAPAPALRDVAGLLRSLDYAARHRLLGHPDEARLRGAADNWVERCQAAFCAGYAHAGGMDPRTHAALLRALMLEKAVYEVIYEARHRPSWLPIPLESIAAA
jgi:maltokinase